jgi:hypothetical protein
VDGGGEASPGDDAWRFGAMHFNVDYIGRLVGGLVLTCCT